MLSRKFQAQERRPIEPGSGRKAREHSSLYLQPAAMVHILQIGCKCLNHTRSRCAAAGRAAVSIQMVNNPIQSNMLRLSCGRLSALSGQPKFVEKRMHMLKRLSLMYLVKLSFHPQCKLGTGLLQKRESVART